MGISDIGGCNDSLVFYFGFYLGLFFCLSFAHFAFVKTPSLYYYIIISALLLTSLILIELFGWLLGILWRGGAGGFGFVFDS